MHNESYNISVVVPLYNEEDCINELHDRIVTVMDTTNHDYEIVFINDGSSDGTLKLLGEIQRGHAKVKLIDLRGNHGQTAALAAGFDHASGDVIIPMDGDLQHLPEEIPLFIEKIDEGYDVVSGWRQKRKESLLLRRIPSLVANRLIGFVSGVNVHDFGTTFKAYRRDILERITLYGDFHRFIPAFAGKMSAKVTEVKIEAPERGTGKSSYGFSRTWTVFFDLLRIRFLLSFLSRPLQFFGSGGFVLMGVGVIMALFLLKERYMDEGAIMGERGPFIIAAVFLLLAGMQLLSLGFLGEMLTRLYHETKTESLYTVKEISGSGLDGKKSLS